MKIRKMWRKGIGIGQIAATLLVVLPTLAFSITYITDYWRIMQIDYKLKIIANLASDYADSLEDTTQFTGITEFQTRASTLCPGGKTIEFPTVAYTGAAGEISITVEHDTGEDSVYLKNKKLSTIMQTYSYHDQNLTVTIKCP